MLKAPAFRTIDGVTLYRDDQLWYRFYPIASYPRIRLDENGKPVFLLIKFALSDADRAENPSLPEGGGHLNFDVTFSLTGEEEAKVRETMQLWVGEEWERLRNGTDEERSWPGVAGASEPPEVELGAPTYARGTVNMFAPQSELLVGNQVAEGEPDLLSGNIAVFSMDLTAAGATFMERTLAGESATDLTPVQVAYDLAFWARLPAARIHVSADSERIYEQCRKYMDGAGIDNCTTYDFENSDISSESASVTGLIEVQIDPGSASIEPSVMEELRRYALDLMQQLIEARFFTEDPDEGHHPGFPDGLPPELLDEERRKQRGSRNSKKYLRQTFDRTEMHVELNLEQHSVVEWTIHPQATLETFFAGMSRAELEQFVRVIPLNDPFFESLGLTVRAFADFADPLLEVVEVEVRYRGTDDSGALQEKGETFTFTSPEPQSWAPRLIGGKREYEYRYRIKLAGQPFGTPAAWQASTANDLNISVPSPGHIEVDVRAGDLDFEEVMQNVQVTLAYEDPDAGIPREEQTIVLSSTVLEDSYRRRIPDIVRRPVLYRRRFRLRSGDVIADDRWQETVSHQLLINQPFDAIMRVRLLPAGAGWDEVVQVLVELKYSDLANHFEASETVALKSIQEFRTWQLLLRNRDKRDFEYRVHASYKNGDFESSAPKRVVGDGVLPIEVRPPSETAIRVVPERLDLEAAPVTEVQLRHPDSGREQTLVFQERIVQNWKVPVAPGAPISYSVQVTHFPAVGEPVALPPVVEDDTIVVLPPYLPPKPGVLHIRIMPTLIDFAATPLVTVDMVYEDDVNEIRVMQSFAFSDAESQFWEVPVKDINHKLYGYTVTYFVAPDNTPHVQNLRFQEKNLLIIERFQGG